MLTTVETIGEIGTNLQNVTSEFSLEVGVDDASHSFQNNQIHLVGDQRVGQ